MSANGQCEAVMARRPWYRWDRFPLLPSWGHRPESDHSRADWWFDWLGIRVWTMMSPDIGASVGLSDQDIEVRLYVPYAIIRFALPVFPRALHQKTWRTKPWPRSAR